MDNLIDLLANANNAIVETWAIFITVNTATIGWVLSKKSAFSSHHVWIAILGYAAFTYSIFTIVEARYEYRNAILLDLKNQVKAEKVQKEQEATSVRADFPENIAKYIAKQSIDYKFKTCVWLILSWFLISLVFYYDGKGQFHPTIVNSDNSHGKCNGA